MSAITDWAAKEQADLTGISSRLDAITTGVQQLHDMIRQFQNSPGSLSASDQAALDAIEKASADLLTKAQAIDTSAPGSASGGGEI